MVYIDLLANPEGHTGYDGEPARRVWRAIYEENCFDLEEQPSPKEQLVLAWRRDVLNDAAPIERQCLERRVFYKLVSGLQASISTHIAQSDFAFWEVVSAAPRSFRRRFSAFVGAFYETCLPSEAGDDKCEEATTPAQQRASPLFVNDALFVDRVGGHRDRLDNLYFAYLFVLRAVTVAKDELLAYAYETGDAADDAATAQLVRALVAGTTADPPKATSWGETAGTGGGFDDGGGGGSSCAAASAARAAFDETMLFAAPEDDRMSPLERALAREHVDELRGQFVNRFHNISKIMDCVTCERCRLWGKLQILGLGTALKILLADGDEFGLGVLQRNEVVALINTLAQLAKSVDSIRDWQRRDVRRATAKMGLLACLAAAALVVVAFGLARALPR